MYWGGHVFFSARKKTLDKFSILHLNSMIFIGYCASVFVVESVKGKLSKIQVHFLEKDGEIVTF